MRFGIEMRPSGESDKGRITSEVPVTVNTVEHDINVNLSSFQRLRHLTETRPK